MTTRNHDPRGNPPASPSIIADYRLLPGVPDEMIDPSGRLRRAGIDSWPLLTRWAKTSLRPVSSAPTNICATPGCSLPHL